MALPPVARFTVAASQRSHLANQQYAPVPPPLRQRRSPPPAQQAPPAAHVPQKPIDEELRDLGAGRMMLGVVDATDGYDNLRSGRHVVGAAQVITGAAEALLAYPQMIAKVMQLGAMKLWDKAAELVNDDSLAMNAVGVGLGILAFIARLLAMMLTFLSAIPASIGTFAADVVHLALPADARDKHQAERRYFVDDAAARPA